MKTSIDFFRSKKIRLCEKGDKKLWLFSQKFMTKTENGNHSDVKYFKCSSKKSIISYWFKHNLLLFIPRLLHWCFFLKKVINISFSQSWKILKVRVKINWSIVHKNSNANAENKCNLTSWIWGWRNHHSDFFNLLNHVRYISIQLYENIMHNVLFSFYLEIISK